MIDLHTHSSVSDGNFSPSSLMEHAAKQGLSALALTDHETIGGIDQAAKAAAEHKMRFIPGVELEITWNRNGEFHLLGLGIERPTVDFVSALEELARRRRERNLEMVNMMNKAGISVSYDEIIAFATGHSAHGQHSSGQNSPSIGRPHFAAFLVKRKIARNMEQAFLRYLGRDRVFYIPKAGLEFERAVKLIHESGGIAILAHPMSLYTAWGRLPPLLEDLKERGLDGLEAWHPSAKVTSCLRLEEQAKRLKIHITAGSDFHGEARPGRKLGITAGGRKIDKSFLENIPQLGRYMIRTCDPHGVNVVL